MTQRLNAVTAAGEKPNYSVSARNSSTIQVNFCVTVYVYMVPFSKKKKIRVLCELLEKVPSGKVQETIVLEKVKVEEGQEQTFQGP